MSADKDEDELIRSVALQNAQHILAARQRLERELAAERERLRITLASIGDAVISTDAEGRVTFLNGVAETLTGWTRAEAAGRPLTDVFRIVNEYTRQPVENPALRALREGTVVGLANHTVLIARDGTERPIDDSAAPIRSESGAPIGAVLVFRDVTERKRAHEARARLAAIVESSDDAIVSKDLDGVILSWNAGAERLFGYSAREAVGRPITLIIPPDRLDEESVILERLRRGERVEPFETVRVRKDGRAVDISVSMSPVRDDSGRVVAASKVARDISAQKRAESALRESEARYRAIVETTPECVKLVAPDGTLLQMNPAGLAMIEADEAGAVLGRSIYDVVAPEHRDAFRAFNDRVCRGERGTLEYEIVGLRGTRRHMETVAVPLPASGGGFTHLAVTRDVTERATAALALADSRARLDYAVRLSGVGFWYCDLPFDVLNWDDRVKEHFWLPSDAQVTIETFYDRIHPDDREPTRRAIEASIRDRVPFDVDYRTVDPASGAVKWVRALGGAAFAPDGTPIRFDGVTVDVTAQKLDQLRLAQLLDREREQGRLLGEVADAALTIHSSGSLDSVLRVVAGEARRILGARWAASSLTEGDGRSQAIHTVASSEDLDLGIDPRAVPVPRALYDEVRRTNRPMRLAWAAPEGLASHREPVGHGERPAPPRGWLAAPLVSRGGKSLGLIQLADKADGDFSEHDEAVLVQLAHIASVAVENARLNDELRQQDRRKDEFLALLAHELRNPLAPLRNGLQVMRLAADDAGAVAQARGMMERQLGHMVRLIEDLLDVARINQNKMELRRERVLLEDVVASAVETARPLIEAAGHELTVSLPAQPVPLDADLTRLAQVFSNLLTNSAKYTERGGHIRLAAESRGAEVIVSVRDTGIGIPAEALPRLFDMFSQVDRSIERSTGGLGIGLALVKGLVEMHGGTVEAASDGLGLGSTFTARLPVVAASAEPVSARPGGGRPAAGGGRRILVVDDSRDSAVSMAKVLKLLGAEVRTAHDGLEAVEAASAFHPEVILMDVGMPRLNGYEATRRIREQPWGRDVTVIALTGWGQEGDKAMSREAGCDGHLVKPVSLDDLEALLAQLDDDRGRERPFR